MQMDLVNTFAKLWAILINPTEKVNTLVEMNDTMLLVQHQPSEPEFEEIITNTNVVIAAFTTAYARLKLYSYMEPLGDRVMYTDTGT